MNQSDYNVKSCYGLIAQWLAIAVGGEESAGGIGLQHGAFSPIGRPHGEAMDVLWRLGIAAKHSPPLEFRFVCDLDEVQTFAVRGFDTGPEFSALLETFVELAIYYGTAETRRDASFRVHPDVHELFEGLSVLGFVRTMDDGFAWTDRVRPIMEKLHNFEFDDDPEETRLHKDVRGMIERLTSKEVEELEALSKSGNKIQFVARFNEIAGLTDRTLLEGIYAYNHNLLPKLKLKRPVDAKPFRYIGLGSDE